MRIEFHNNHLCITLRYNMGRIIHLSADRKLMLTDIQLRDFQRSAFMEYQLRISQWKCKYRCRPAALQYITTTYIRP